MAIIYQNHEVKKKGKERWILLKRGSQWGRGFPFFEKNIDGNLCFESIYIYASVNINISVYINSSTAKLDTTLSYTTTNTQYQFQPKTHSEFNPHPPLNLTLNKTLKHKHRPHVWPTQGEPTLSLIIWFNE